MSLTHRHHKKLPREELILLAQRNDYHALEELIRREQKNVYAALYYLNADNSDISDLAQEVLFRMAKNIKNLREPSKFQSWLNQIITNLFYDELRKKQKKPDILPLEHEINDNHTQNKVIEIKDKKKLPQENTLASELNLKIINAIHSLPEQFRIAIILRELQGLSYEEISGITQSSIGTIKSRIARARAKLQEILKPYLVQ